MTQLTLRSVPEAAETEDQLRTVAAAQGTVLAGDVALYRQALTRGWDASRIATVLGFDAAYSARIRAQLERQGLA